MLTAVDITNSRGDTLHLPLMDISGGYVVREVKGLDPVSASLTSSSTAEEDGAQPQFARRGPRNVTMKLGLKPDYNVNTVQSLRSALYPYLMPKLNIKLDFYLDNVLYVTTDGQIEDFSNEMFTQDPEVNISILCYDPDFYAPSAITASDFTQSDNVTTKLIQYNGTSDAGFVFTLNINRALSGFTLTNTTPDNVKRSLEIAGASFVSGDVLTITTIKGQKAIVFNRAGLVSSILYFKTDVSEWPFLQNGNNNLGAFCSGAGIPWSLSYTPKYGGI